MQRTSFIPTRRLDRNSGILLTLGPSQYVVVLAALCAIAAVITILLAWDISEELYRLAVYEREGTFGFEIALVRSGWSPASDQHVWVISRVTADGRMARAGIKPGDMIFTGHGGQFGELYWALRGAAAGRTGCVTVANIEDWRAGSFSTREVCLSRVISK